MKIEDIYSNLCSYDKRNPMYGDITYGLDEDCIQSPREKTCFCDNCFYGRDKLALSLLNSIRETQQAWEVAEDYKRLLTKSKAI